MAHCDGISRVSVCVGGQGDWPVWRSLVCINTPTALVWLLTLQSPAHRAVNKYLSCRRWTRATRCLTRIVLYTEMDAQWPRSSTERWQLIAGFVADSKYKIQALFKDPNCIFQAPKLSTKSHILEADIQNLDCNVTPKCTVLYSPSACFKIVNKCKISKFARFKFKDFSRIFKYFQAPYLFSSTFKGL